MPRAPHSSALLAGRRRAKRSVFSASCGRDVIEALEQRQGHAVDLADRPRSASPSACQTKASAASKSGSAGGAGCEPLERCGKTLEALDQGGFFVHPVSLKWRSGARDFTCERGLVLL